MVDFEKHNKYVNTHVQRTMNESTPDLSAPNLSQIIKAIEGMRIIELFYNGNYRTIEPHLCGQSRKGNTLLRCWQTEGGSVSQKVPDWKLFDLKKITSLNLTNRQFHHPQPEYNPDDKAMIKIYARL